MVEAKVYGTIWMIAIIVSWVYYTVWIMVSPLIDNTHPIQDYFPERKWGIHIPIFIGVIFIVFALTFVGIALIKESRYDEIIK